MGAVIDSSLWVDYFRRGTPRSVLEQVIGLVDDADALLCEPVRFEILRAALRAERKRIDAVFDTIPLLPSPHDLWHQAALLGQRCLDAGFHPRTMDLLIAQVALHHGAELMTFDKHFADIARVTPLKLQLLKRAAA